MNEIMKPKKLAAGLYRLQNGTIAYLRPGRALGLVGHNRNRPNATVKCTVWQVCRSGAVGADLVEFLETVNWRRSPGEELAQFETLAEAAEFAKNL